MVRYTQRPPRKGRFLSAMGQKGKLENWKEIAPTNPSHAPTALCSSTGRLHAPPGVHPWPHQKLPAAAPQGPPAVISHLSAHLHLRRPARVHLPPPAPIFGRLAATARRVHELALLRHGRTGRARRAQRRRGRRPQQQLDGRRSRTPGAVHRARPKGEAAMAARGRGKERDACVRLCVVC